MVAQAHPTQADLLQRCYRPDSKSLLSIRLSAVRLGYRLQDCSCCWTCRRSDVAALNGRASVETEVVEGR